MNQGTSCFSNDPGFYKSDVEEPHAKPLTKNVLTEPDKVARIEQETDMGELWKDNSKENNLNFKTWGGAFGKTVDVLKDFCKKSPLLWTCYKYHPSREGLHNLELRILGWKTEFFVNFQ